MLITNVDLIFIDSHFLIVFVTNLLSFVLDGGTWVRDSKGVIEVYFEGVFICVITVKVEGELNAVILLFLSANVHLSFIDTYLLMYSFSFFE